MKIDLREDAKNYLRKKNEINITLDLHQACS